MAAMAMAAAAAAAAAVVLASAESVERSLPEEMPTRGRCGSEAEWQGWYRLPHGSMTISALALPDVVVRVGVGMRDLERGRGRGRPT